MVSKVIKYSSRKQFMLSKGATCTNVAWSWCWVNHEEKVVYFGASSVHEKGNAQLILGKHWEADRLGKKKNGFGDALEKIALIQNEGYNLYTFRQFQEEIDQERGTVKITGFEQDVERRYLAVRNDGWYAIPLGEFDPVENLPEMIESVVYLEGSKIPVSRTAIERNTRAREACLKIHGMRCKVCEFDFEKKYGELGAGFIHVHHLHPISNTKGEHIVCPGKDLMPVCPNCHAMIHRNGKNRTLNEIRALIAQHSGS